MRLDGPRRTRAARLVPKRYRLLARRTWRLAETTLDPRTRRINEHPVLIIGNQKAGTSAIAGLLAEATDSTVTIDLLGELIDPSLPAVASGDLPFDDFVSGNRADFSRDIVKECHMTFHLDELRPRFPESPIIFVLRDPRTNIRSLMNRWGVPGTSVDLPSDVVAELGPGWRRVLGGSDHGGGGVTDLDRLSYRWQAMAQIYLNHEDDLVLARYEDFMQDKIGFIDALARNVGMEPTEDISARMDYQYQPAGSKRASLLEFFGSENLARIEEICGPEMTRLDYSVSSPPPGSDRISDE